MLPRAIGWGWGWQAPTLLGRLMKTVLYQVNDAGSRRHKRPSRCAPESAVLAGYIPARSATLVDPMVALPRRINFA